MFDLFNESDRQPEGEPFGGPEPGYLEIAGKGIMRGGVRLAKGAAIIGALPFPSEGEDGPDPERIIPRKEDFFRFVDERLDPAEKYWSVDSGTLTTSKKIVSAVAELPLQLVGGPNLAAASMGLNTGVDMLNQGVGTNTAAATAALSGGAMAAMIALPQAGTTIKETLALIAANPLTGAATDFATKSLLKSQGYDEQARAIDPFDIPARSVDLLLGGIFGGVAHYGKWRAKAPTEVVDAIDTVEASRQRENLNPFRGAEPEHGAALESALESITEGRPVDVRQHLPKIEPEPLGYTAEKFRSDAQAHFDLTDEQADVAVALVAARARVAGEELDGYISKRISEVTAAAPEGPALFQEAPAADTSAFRTWFGDSKILDETGAPRVVYHGTNADFTEFAPGVRGIFFSESREVASNYTEYKRSPQSTHDGIVMPVYLSMKKPVLLEFGTGRSIASAVEEARANGNDGVIVKGYPDTYQGKDAIADMYIVFEPTQVKSAMGNRGTYDPNNASILFQGEKGAVSFREDGRAVIHALEAPDFTTLVHEIGHVFRRDLSRSDLNLLDTWMFSQVPGAKWEARHEEVFARTFERYLAENRAPSPELETLFAKFRSFIMEIYQRITGSAIDQKINPQVRGVFDRLLWDEKMKSDLPPEVLAIREEISSQAREMEAEHAAFDVQPDEPPPPPRQWTEAQEAASRRVSEQARQVNRQSDSAITAISKLGGLDIAEATSQWGRMVTDGRKALNDHVLKETRRFGAVFKKDGVSLDRMRENLIQHGYLPEGADINALHDLVEAGTRGDFARSQEFASDLDALEQQYLESKGYSSAADLLLAEQGDIMLHEGTDAEGQDVYRSAQEVLDELRAEIEMEQGQEHLYQRAAFCLNLG